MSWKHLLHDGLHALLWMLAAFCALVVTHEVWGWPSW